MANVIDVLASTNTGFQPKKDIVEEPEAPSPLGNTSGDIKEIKDTYGIGDAAEAFSDGVKTSPIGMSVRRAFQGTFNPLISYKPSSQEEMNSLLREVNYDKDLLKLALDGAENLEEVRKNMDLLMENKRIERKLADSPWYMAFVGGAGQMIGNPVDIGVAAASVLAPPVGGTLAAVRTGAILGKAGKVIAPIATNVVSGVASNQLQEVTTGIDHDVWTDVASITAVTLGIKGLKATGNSARQVALNHDKMLNGETVNTSGVLGKVSKATLPFATRMNDVREQLESRLPTVELKSKFKNIIDDATAPPEVKEFLKSITDYEQGIRARGGRNFYAIDRERQSLEQVKGITHPEPTLAYGSGKTTLMEEVEGFHVEDNRLLDSVTNKMSDATALYGRDEVNRFLMVKLSGKDTSRFGDEMNNDKLLNEIAESFSKAYESRGLQLVHHDLVNNIYSFAKYIPVAIDRYKMGDFVKAIGDDETAGRILSTNLYNGVLKDKTTYKQMFQIWREEMAASKEGKLLAALPKGKVKRKTKAQQEFEDNENFRIWLSEEADKASYGYRDQNSSLSESFDYREPRVNFQKRRLPWNTSYVDEDGFSVDSLRADILDTARNYFSTTSGLLATKRVYGLDYEGMKDRINYLGNSVMLSKHRKPTSKEEFVRDATAILNRAYGKALSDADYDVSDAVSLIARNLTYASYSTLMGILNYGEVAGALRAWSLKYTAQALPVVREVYDKFYNKDLTKEERRYIQDFFVGKEVHKLMRVREIIRSNQERYREVNPYLSTAVGISQVMAEYSPGNMVMRYSNDSLIDAAQSCFWAELINKSHATKSNYRGFLRDIDLKRVDLSKEDYSYMLRRLKKFTSIKDGKMSLDESFGQLVNDDRFTFAFRRMTDYVCNETLQRRGLDDIFMWQLGKNNPFISLITQFKTFAIQSYNKRFVKMMNRLEDEGALSQLNQFMITSALTGLTTIAQLNLRTLGMEDEEREKYLKNTLGFSSISELFDGDDDTSLGTFAFNIFINRNPYFAAPALLLNSMGIGTKAKTTARTYANEEDSKWASAPDLGQAIIDMSPALRLASSYVAGAYGSYNLIRDSIFDEDTYKERKKTIGQIKYGLSGLPNIPLITPSLRGYVNEQLEDYKYGF